MNVKFIALISCIVAAIGSLMPWASIQTAFGTIDVAGTTGDGQLTLALAVLAAAFCYFGKRAMLLFGMIACLLGLSISIYDIANITTNFTTSNVAIVTIGFGLYLCVIGFVVGFFSMRSLRKQIVSTKKIDVSLPTFAPPTFIK